MIEGVTRYLIRCYLCKGKGKNEYYPSNTFREVEITTCDHCNGVGKMVKTIMIESLHFEEEENEEG